jgi:uncharacterized repeat protein (TIGR02543 family)
MMKNTMSLFSKIRGEDGGGSSMSLCMGCMELFDTNLGVCPHCGYIYGMGAEEPVFLEPGTVLAGRYYVGRALGHGSFGVTYIGWDAKLEQKVAIKEFLPSEFSTRMPGKTMVTILAGKKSEQFLDGKRKFINEARKLAKFHSEPGIVKVFDSFEENDSAYIVMELLEGRTLTDCLKEYGTIQENTAIDLLRPVMESLQVVHSEGIIHRDISPDNIFVCNSGEVKLIDFGAARYATTSHTRTITTIIKSGYSPEEQYRSSGDQGPHTDVYALGATLYKMITGKTPPDGYERRTMYETQGKDLLKSPAEYQKSISRVHEVAILNAMNIQIQDRTPDVASFIQELDSDVPVRRLDGTIKKLPTYRWPKWLKIAIPTAAALIATFIILMLTGVIRFPRNENENIVIPDQYVEVPNIEKMAEEDAVLRVQEAGLKPQMGKSISSPYCDPGVVIYQEYIAGAYIEKGSILTYKVSIGTGEIKEDGDMIIIPFLKGLTYEEAEQMLSDAGLSIEVEEVYYDSDAGLVVSTEPEEGAKVDKNSTIKLMVSKGSKPFALELNLVGMQEAEAGKALTDIGLAYPDITYVENDAEKGTVLEQSVAVGTMVTKGQKIQLTVSGGASEKLIEVPDVTGLAEQKAKETLEDKGFKVKISKEYSAKIPAGSATKTSPKAGSKRYKDEVIMLYISNGPEPSEDSKEDKTKDSTDKVKDEDKPKPEPEPEPEEVKIKVPDVKNMSEKKALAALSAFTVMTDTSYSDDIAEGYAIGTKPKAGTQLKEGDSVSLVVSLGPKPPEIVYITIPDVSNLSEQKAKDALTGLAVTTVTEYSKTVAEGYAIGTNPAAGTKVQEGDTVSLTISLGPPKHTLYFDANGGTVSETSRTVTEGSKFVTLPLPSRDYYEFEGWYKDKSGSGSSVSTSDVMGSSDMTLYAVWSIKIPTDWVLASKAPSDAQIVSTKWTYSKSEYTTSTESSKSGWTCYDQKTTYGNWGDWTPNPISPGNGIEVETRVVQIHTGYNMEEWNYASTSGRMYYNYDPGVDWAYVWHRTDWRSVSELAGCERVTPGGWSSSGSYTGKNAGNADGYNITDGLIYFITSYTYDNQTQYRKRTVTTTYYYVRVLNNQESYTEVTEGGDIANVQKWVKYRPR